jgi:hypothetical protein
VPYYPFGQPITLSTAIRNPANGALADPTDLSLVIRDPAGVSATYDYNPGAIVRDSVGVFHLALAAPALPGHYEARWLSTGSNAGALETTLDVLIAFSPALVDLADLKTTLQIPAATTTFDDELRRYIVAATPLVESMIGGPVITRQVTEAPVRSRGGGLFLSTANPVSITSITSIPDGATVDVAGTWLDSRGGMVHRRSGGWWAGCGPYSVVMQAGLGSVPAEVSLAAQVIAQHIWETQHAPANAPGVSGNETPTPFLGAFAVPNRARELLAPHLPILIA